MNIQKIRPTDSQFTEEFITAHADFIDWVYINKNIEKCVYFSDEFFLKFNRMIFWRKIHPFYKLTTEFVYKYRDKLQFVAWYNENKKLHQDNDAPAIIYANETKCWLQNGEIHRDNDLPAMIYVDGSCLWYQNGKLHRDNDAPAIIYASGRKDWYQNGLRHRDNDEPAIIYGNGDRFWYQNGKLHRDGSPSIIYADGTNSSVRTIKHLFESHLHFCFNHVLLYETNKKNNSN